uniref:Partner of Y14 and mago n=1 Tax=Panagrolaimus superbus TaxID=310955 RepID=A0A914XS53_9BILA
MSKPETGGDNRIKTKTGETFIAATQRPDGTWRKPRRVKEGYVPPEEQPKYKCPAAVEVEKETTVSSGPKYPVGWSPLELKQMAENAQRKKTDQVRLPVAASMASNAPITPQDHINKKLLNLRKKLNDIEKLQTKAESGETKLELNQQQKIERKPEIEAEIDKLTKELEEL